MPKVTVDGIELEVPQCGSGIGELRRHGVDPGFPRGLLDARPRRLVLAPPPTEGADTSSDGAPRYGETRDWPTVLRFVQARRQRMLVVGAEDLTAESVVSSERIPSWRSPVYACSAARSGKIAASGGPTFGMAGLPNPWAAAARLLEPLLRVVLKPEV